MTNTCRNTYRNNARKKINTAIIQQENQEQQTKYIKQLKAHITSQYIHKYINKDRKVELNNEGHIETTKDMMA